MDLAELLLVVREELDDEVEPYLWTDTQLVRFLNEGVREAAVRARLLVESQLQEVCEIELQPGQASYPLHPAVILIRRAALQSDLSSPLCRTTTAAMDDNCSNWRTSQGQPDYLVVDQQGAGRTVVLAPIPAKAETLHLTVLRWPTEDEELEVGDEGGEPAIERQHHDKLVHWAAFRALNKRDAEQEAKSDAGDQLALFEAHFGPRPTARELQQLAIDRLTGVPAVWF